MAKTEIDGELAKSLQMARKKPRNFAIIAKGATCLKLLISKKPIKDGELAKAKSECHGNAVVRGVVTGGDGGELAFQVTETPAIAEAKLKTFIREEAGLNITPRFVVLETVPEINEDATEEPGEVQAEVSVPPQESSSTVAPAPVEPDGTVAREQSLQAFKALTAHAQKVAVAQPARKGEILAALSTIKQLLSDGKLDDAKDAMVQCGELLNGMQGPGTQGSTAPGLGPLPGAEKYAQALNTWRQAAAAALAGVDKLVSSLEATGDELALAISGVIQKAQADFPDTVDDVLSGLVTGAKAGKPEDAESYRNKSEIAVRAALAYLNNNAQTIEGCENNPFGVRVQFRAPLTEALKQVLLSVKV